MRVLGDYIKIKHGFAFKGTGISNEDNGVVLVTPGNFAIGGGFKEDKCKFFTEEYPEEYCLSTDDLIVTMTDLSKGIDTLGYSALVPESKRIYLHNQRIGLVEMIRDDVDKHFIYWFMRTHMYQRTIAGSSSGTTVHHTSPSRICEIEVDFPSLKVQKKIALVLDKIEEKIKLNEVINDNLQQQAATIFKSWFVNYIPFGGIAPEEWGDAKLEGLTTLVSRGISPKYSDTSDQKVINQKCIRNHMIDLSLARTHIPKVINEKWLRFGDLLINSTGDGTLGRVAQVWFQPQNLTVDSHVTIVRPAKENLIFYIGLWGALHEKEIEALHTGSTGQTELPRDRIKMLELLLPDDATLDRFNAIIAPMATSIVSNQRENQKLAALRDALLPKLIFGEIDVSAIQY